MANEHSGHRKRMRDRFLSTRFDGFEEHQILEMLLFYVYPRQDTNTIAHRLLDTFGSLSAVLEAPVERLCDAGLSQNAAVFLSMLPDISRVYLDDKHNNKKKIIDINNVGEYFLSKFIGRCDECLILLLLDAKCKELYCGVVSSGTNMGAEVSVRTIVDLSLRYKSSYAVIAHNHPSGVALPSKADIAATGTISSALKLVGIRLIDHFIVADGDYISLKESSLCSGLIVSED